MAHAPRTAANKSRKGASTSASTRASRASASSKKGAASPADDDWSPRDQEDAMLQGWGVFHCIDMKTKKLFLILQGEGARFKTDNDARMFVTAQSEQGDQLATRAIRAVFRSMAGNARSK